MVSSYQQFVKDHIHEFKHLPAKERMGAVAQLYKKGPGVPAEVPVKKGRGRPKKSGGALITGAGVDEKGGSMLGSLIPFGNMLGLGLDEKLMKKGKGRPKKSGAGVDEKGGSILGSLIPFGNMLGLGLDEKNKKGGMMSGAGMHKSRGRPKKSGGALMTGAGMVESPTMSGYAGGDFGDWFFKGLTAPFAVASKIPIPGVQQIGQAGTNAFNAIGAPTLF